MKSSSGLLLLMNVPQHCRESNEEEGCEQNMDLYYWFVDLTRISTLSVERTSGSYWHKHGVLASLIRHGMQVS